MSAAVKAGYYYVWFAVLLDANATVDTWLDERFAVSTHLVFEFRGYSDFSGHRNVPGNVNIALCLFWVFVYDFPRQVE